MLAAHERSDKGALVDIYIEIADRAAQSQDIDAECFFLTHAWIFALDSDHPLRDDLQKRLSAHGRV